jgi:hypothetical protein
MVGFVGILLSEGEKAEKLEYRISFSWEQEFTRIQSTLKSNADCVETVFRQVIEQRQENLGRRIGEENIRKLLEQYRNDLAQTCGQLIAGNYQRRIWGTLRSMVKEDRLYELPMNIALLSQRLIKHMAPLLTSFVVYVLEECQRFKIEKVIFLDRDANALYVIAKTLSEDFYRELEVSLVPLNRALFGITDHVGLDGREYPEIIRTSANKVAQNRILMKYLKNLLSEEPYAIVDVGLYGSIAGVLDYLHKNMGFLGQPFVFYFASRNPYIYGFVNNYLTALPIPVSDWPCWVELFADSVEALAKTHGPVEPTYTKNKISLLARPIGCLFEASGWGIIIGLREYTAYQAPKEWSKLKHPDALIREAYVRIKKASRFEPTFYLEQHAPPSPYGHSLLKEWHQGSLMPLTFEAPFKSGVVPLCKCYGG